MCKRSVHVVSCLLVLTLAGSTFGDLIGHWKFDEGSGDTAQDSSGKNHHGKILGTPAWATGVNGLDSALAFNPCGGVDCGVWDPTNGKGKFSLALWAYWDGTGTFQHFLTKSNSYGATTMMFQVELWGAHTNAAYTDRVGISYQAAGSIAFSVMPKNEWTHLTFVFDGTNLRCYLNGIDEQGPKPFSIGPNIDAPVLIGVYGDKVQRVFHGMMDDFRLYDHALTAAEVEVLCAPSKAVKDPEPANGAVGVVTPLLRWKAGYKAVLYDVYFGITPDLGPANLVQARSPVTMYWHIPPLQPGVTYYWRVDGIEADMKTVNPGHVWSFTTQALTAYLPDPPDGSVDVAPAATLKWAPGQAAVKHQVFFSSNREAVVQGAASADKGSVTTTSFSPGTLESVTTYYWRVDETVVPAAVKPGPVWSFTTHLPVEDFESYTDNDGNRIYETWIDGWTNNTGSTVGNIQAPFAEQTIVRSGKQSMPLDYNNVKAPYYSEAERTWAKAQDWTVGGVEILVLNLRGQATNGAGPIYVAVKDSSGRTAVVTHPDAAAFRATSWRTWKIPLSAFSDAGVRMTAVKTLYLGVGNRTTPTPGGAGRLFVDDIRVAKP
ncbi:MAG: LamG domain-containing protein [Planctomycetes bacterium]|nr:LamG domain-containing protein [Planctomycetota bacterium]